MRFREGSQSFHRRYLIFEPLGAGGMAAVYRAKDRLGGYVALKRLVTDATRIAARNAVANPVETTALVPEEGAGGTPATRELNTTLSSIELPATVAPETVGPASEPRLMSSS